MQVSSELPSVAENIASALFPAGAQSVEGMYVEDEEFPSDIPVHYERMLQPPFRRTSRRILGFIAVMVAALLLAVSAYLLHNRPNRLSSCCPSVVITSAAHN